MADDAIPIVEFRDVSYAIGDVSVIRGLSLEVSKGEVFVLLGESGCGKTTTLKLINRLIEPTSGTVLVNGMDTEDQDLLGLRRQIGYVIQDGGLFPHMSVVDNVGVVLRLEGHEADRIRGRSAEVLEVVGLDPAKFGGRFPHELSGGQRQRVGVARALASDPDLMLLDEPFGALDALTRAGLQAEFARLVRELGKTAVLVTHDLHEAMILGSRIALMDKGTFLLVDDAEGFRRSDIPLVRAYLDTVLVPA